MNIIYVKGDVFSGEEKFKVHGCNAQGVMGSGVAKIVKERYPSAFKVYRDMWEVDQALPVGHISSAYIPNVDIYIVNLVTQDFFGRTGARFVQYDTLRTAFENLNEFFLPFNLKNPRVAMPKIGAGLGGGDWDIISKIIEETSSNYQPVVYEL